MHRIAFTFRITIFFFLLFLSLFSPFFARAQDASPAASPQPVDSYNLFWPLSAGKTKADTLYNLKLFKETIQGWFVFGDTKKVDYAILLGVKRVLEAEKLISEGKNDLATETLEVAVIRFSEAYDFAKKAHGKGKFVPKEVRRDRVVNVKRLVEKLKIGAPSEVVAVLDKVGGKASLLLSDYLASSKTKTETLTSAGSH